MYILNIHVHNCIYMSSPSSPKQQTASSHSPCLHKLFGTNIFQFPCQHCHFERFDRANRFFLKPTVGGWNPMNPINSPLLILRNQSSETDVGGIYMWLKKKGKKSGNLFCHDADTKKKYPWYPWNWTIPQEDGPNDL